tara:strand:+ start:191 stop:832 length:642 start_codon:yes stop_codon:yes gene_type:complete
MLALKNNKDSILNFKDYLKLNESASESESLLCRRVFKDIVDKIKGRPSSLEYLSFNLSVDTDTIEYEGSIAGGNININDVDLYVKLKPTQNNIDPSLSDLFTSNDFSIHGISGLSDIIDGDTELLDMLGIYDNSDIDIYIGPFEISGVLEDTVEWNIGEESILINITTDGHDSVETRIHIDDPELGKYINSLLDFMDEHSAPENIEYEFMRAK